jgi:hypothetical protein
VLAACHSNPNYPPGTPVVTMSDLTNSGDFMSYIVNIDSIELTRNDGVIATPLLTPVTVDLAELNTMTALLEAPAVPAGTYTSALVTLDYTLTPVVWLNVNGQTLSATPVNAVGQPMTAVGVTVTFDPSHPLVVPLNQSVRLQVDVDLTASNEITTTTSPAEVQVQPFVVVTPAPVDTSVMRLRGLFVTTQDVSSGFYMNALPTLNGFSPLGAVIVNTNAQTYFNVNGIVYTGAPGLAALAQQQQNVPMAVYGTLDNLSGITPTFNATQVYFGTGEASQVAFYFTGTVAARSADTITLRGGTYIIPPNYITTLGLSYLDSLPVTLGSGTAVYEDGVAAPGLTIADISVGQQITVAGQPSLNSSLAPVSMDATSGLVRLRPTTLWGTLNTDGTLDLLSLGRFAPAAFNFAGTGTSGHDATPSAYVVDLSAVPPGPLTTTGELLQVQGGVAPFGTAPPDFTAQAVTPGPSSLQTLVVDWANGGSTAPFTSVSSSGLTVNLADANLGATHEIRTGPASLDLKSLPGSPLITTTGADQSNLQLAIGSTALPTGISVFNSAAKFASAVSSAFKGTNKIFRLVAYGQYDSASNTFVASRINVALHE